MGACRLKRLFASSTDKLYLREALLGSAAVAGIDMIESIKAVGVPTATGYLIYHANTPLSKRVRDEVKGRRT